MNKLQKLLKQARSLDQRGLSTKDIQKKIMDEFIIDKDNYITYEEKHRRMHANDV